MDENRLVDVPAYAKVNKKGRYYARKRDLPYFADEEGVQGCVTLGSPSEEEGKMIPDPTYFWYCTPESVEKKKLAEEERRKAEEERARKKKEEEEERARKEAEEEEARREAFGISYVSMENLPYERYLYPLKGFLAEKFFAENGMSEILDEVLGKERAFLIKLSAAALASKGMHLHYGYLNEYPMKLHVCDEMDREMTSRVWASVKEEEIQSIFRKWIERNAPKSVIAQAVPVTVTLYHDGYSDNMSDSWFCSRIRTGTRFQQKTLFYRDAESLRLLAMEKNKYHADIISGLDDSNEVRNIRESIYPEMKDAALHFFEPGYTFMIRGAMMTGHPTVGWIHPSEYPNQKEMTKKLKELDTVDPVSGWRFVRWEGSYEGKEGHWVLGEELSQRENLDRSVRNILTNYRKRLEAMSYFAASGDTLSWCFEIEQEGEDVDIFDDGRFTVKSVPRASEKMRKDFGRVLCFSTETLPPDEQLRSQAMHEEDMVWHCTSFMNHGETSDVTETFFDAMDGRNLPLFLSCSFREWILRHSGHRFEDNYGMSEYFSDLSSWSCEVFSDREMKTKPMDKKVRTLLEEDYGVTESDVLGYVNEVIRQKRYFPNDEGWM